MAKSVLMELMNVEDDGRFGKAMEMSMTEKDYVKSAGKVDWYHLNEMFEVKTGAGELKISKKGKLVHCKKSCTFPFR